MKYYVDRMCDFPKFRNMDLQLSKDGTVYTQSGDIKTYESGIFSYDSNIPKARFPTTTVSDDGTYMDYSLQLFLNFKRDDSSTSYYYTTNYGTASKTFYYKYTGSGSVITPKKYYLHITGMAFKRNYQNPSFSMYYVRVSVVINENSTNGNGVSMPFDKIDTDLSISVSGQFRESATSNSRNVNGNVYIPANTSFSTNGNYFLDNSCRGDTPGNYTDTNYFNSSNYTNYFTTSCQTSSVGVTLNSGQTLNATVVVHDHP